MEVAGRRGIAEVETVKIVGMEWKSYSGDDGDGQWSY